MGMQEGWARWMVTAGGGGKRIQQGWRALDGGVLGVLLFTCHCSVPMTFYSAARAAGSRHFLREGAERMRCLLPFAWVPVSGEKMFSRPVAVANC